MEYIKHFGENSDDYLRYRPDYPDKLYYYLATLVEERELAWDCGTGNGQAAAKLSEYFKHVIGTDINENQLNIAIKRPNLEYFCCSAEKTELTTSSVDLVTIAQALHWFDFDKFYQEVRRVTKPNGWIAAWSYGLGKINPDIDSVIAKLYYEMLGDQYWPSERRYIDQEYQTIPFPFKKIQTPSIFIEKKINFSHLIGYLNTWSAVKEYQKQNQVNPVDQVFDDLVFAWKEEDNEHIMRWPIYLLVGKVHEK